MSQLLQNALCGAVMILAVSLLRRVLRDRLVPEARLALWAVCLFRLLTPAAPESALSLWGLSRLFAAEQQAAPVAGAPVLLPAPEIAAPAPQPAPGIPWETVLAAIWLAVGAALAARYAVSWLRTRRAVARAVPLDGRDPRYASLPSFARLREGLMEGAPLTFGVARPTVVLSPGLDGAALDCVLAHEGVHARRRDNLWHYAMALALAVHWWNPAVWLMARLLRRDIELSCDRAALRKLGEARRADYANALLTLATQGTDPAFCQTFGRKAAEERILSIMKFKKTSIIGVIFTLSLVLAVTAAFASEPKTDDGTIQFHGETYNRADLSQEALDWLDWYLALPEEEQLAISAFPRDLSDPAPYDAYDSEKTGSEVTASGSIISGFDSVELSILSLEEFQARLAQRVKDGRMTQAEADQRVNDLLALMKLDSLSDIKIPEHDGFCIYVNPEDFTIGGYAFGPHPENFVKEQLLHEIEDAINGNMEVSVQVDLGKTPDNYDVKLPTFDEDGNPVSPDWVATGSIGSQAYDSYEIVTDPNAVSGVVTGGEAVPVAPSASAEPVVVQPLANTAPATACGVAGCTETRYHQHSNGYCFLLSDPCPVDGCTIRGSHDHNGVTYSCNGTGHSDGRCDGSCLVYSQPMQNAGSASYSNSGHHSESHSSGHHGNGHH